VAGNPPQVQIWKCIINKPEISISFEGTKPIQLRYGLVKLAMSASVQVVRSLSLIFLAGRLRHQWWKALRDTRAGPPIN